MLNINLTCVKRIIVEEPQTVNYDGSYWQAGHIVIKNDRNNDENFVLPYSTSHHKENELVPIDVVCAPNDLIEENVRLRAQLAQFSTLLKKFKI